MNKKELFIYVVLERYDYEAIEVAKVFYKEGDAEKFIKEKGRRRNDF